MRSIRRPARREIAGLAGAVATSVGLGAAAALAGPAVLLGRALFYLVAMLVLSAFWDRVAADHLPGALLLPPGGLAVYVGITEWITFSVPSIHLRLEDDIRSGAIEAQLLRPKPYLLLRIGESLGGMLVRLSVLGVAGLVGLLLSGRAGPPLAAYPALLVLGALGGSIGILIFAMVGLSTFWLRKCLPAYLVSQKITFLLGGLLAPVSFYPNWLADLGAASPFGAQLYWPAGLVLTPSLAWFASAVALQVAWLVGLGLMLAGIWRAGLRRLLVGGA